MYPTFQIVYGGTDLHLLARQMGTSIAMLEQHYSHLIPRLRADKPCRTSEALEWAPGSNSKNRHNSASIVLAGRVPPTCPQQKERAYQALKAIERRRMRSEIHRASILIAVGTLLRA